jgi:predicted GH43/DUF377 family glycosyl hydrolase
MSHLRIHRYNGGEPILAPKGSAWESGVTFNAAAVLLEHGQAAQRSIIQQLLAATGSSSDGAGDLVAILYRARPRRDPGYMMNRSYVGLALFTPDLKLIHRFPEPLLAPDVDKLADDYLGVEDPRVTWDAEQITMIYCGAGWVEAQNTWRATLCAATSEDLIHWRKRGALSIAYADVRDGAMGHVNNKDGVLCPGAIDGWHYLLHRPMVGPLSQWSIHLAHSKSPDGPWQDLGAIMRAAHRPGWSDAWIGAGAVPIALGGGRYLSIHHSGHRADDGKRLYTLGASVLDFNRIDPRDPTGIVTARRDHFLVPETKWEIEGLYPDSVGNVVFACGAYERGGDIHIVYGGGDTYILGARVSKQQLLDAMDSV